MVQEIQFNIDICDVFFIIEDCDIANYVNDNPPWLSEKNVEEVSNGLEKCVIKPVSMVYWGRIERKWKQMSFTDKFW